MTATLSTLNINQVSELNLIALISNDNFEVGDCFKINMPQPYTNSRDNYQNAGGTDFYVPFPASANFSVKSSTLAASLARKDDYNLEVTLTAGGGQSLTMVLNSFTNPYSQTQNTAITV